MQPQKTLYLLVLLLSISLSGKAFGNDKEMFIPKDQWSKYSKNYNYTENYKTPKQKSNKPPKTRAPKTSFDGSSLKYIIYGVGILVILFLIGLLIYNIVNGVGGKIKKESLKVATLNNIENIEDADLDNLLNSALAEERFKEAIRIRYLLLLRTLNRLTLILWKKDKTNGAYISEMYGKNGFDLFMQLTIAFDRTWYGDKNISENDYYSLIPLFDQINNIVKASGQ